MEEKEEALLTASPATRATQCFLRYPLEDALTVSSAGTKPCKTGAVLNAFTPCLGGTASTPSATVASSADQVRGARLLRSFLQRRRLGLLKTGGSSSTTDKDLFSSIDEATSEATAGLTSTLRSEVGRGIRENETQHHAAGADAAFCRPVCAAPTSAPTFFGGTVVLDNGVGGGTRARDVHDNDVTSAAGGDCFTQSCRRPAVSEEKQIYGVPLLRQVHSVEDVLRPFSNLRLQLAPSAAAASVASPVSARILDGPPVAHVGDYSHSDVGGRDVCHSECEKVDPHLRSCATRGRIENTASTLPVKLSKEESVTDEHIPSNSFTKNSVSTGRSHLEKDTGIQSAKRSPADASRHLPGAHLETVSRCASPYVLSQLLHEQQNMVRPRPSYFEKEETSADIDPHHILIEQQREAVALAEAAAAVLRRKVQALQAENDRLVSRWSHGRTRNQGHNLKRVSCSADACTGENTALYWYDKDSERAAAGTPDVLQNLLGAHDEIHILKQQLAICRREVHMLSQENDHLRDLCSRRA